MKRLLAALCFIPFAVNAAESTEDTTITKLDAWTQFVTLHVTADNQAALDNQNCDLADRVVVSYHQYSVLKAETAGVTPTEIRFFVEGCTSANSTGTTAPMVLKLVIVP